MSLIDRVLRRADKHRASPAWLEGGVTYYKISAVAAGKLVREAYGASRRAPRPGHAIDLPMTMYNGYHGHWTVYRHGGKYELMFHYRDSL